MKCSVNLEIYNKKSFGLAQQITFGCEWWDGVREGHED